MPIAKQAYVSGWTWPLFGSMQCFTPTTESPSIAATSTARAPPKSSASPAIADWKPPTGAAAEALYSAPADTWPGGGRTGEDGGGAANADGPGGAAIIG